MKIVALDIGGTSIKSGLWIDGELTNRNESDTNAKLGAKFVMERAIEILKGYQEFDRIGISTAGQVDPVLGVIRYANSNIPEYTGTNIKKIMLKEFGVPTAVENDVNCAAIGEARYGAGREFDDFLCINYGTGIGGAIVIDKKIYTGSKFSAGEFGCLLIRANQRVKGDFFSGCYEQHASTSALVKNAMEYDQTMQNGRLIFDRINEVEVKKIVDNWIDEMVFGLSSLIHIFNPSHIVLGGGIIEQGYILDRLKELIYSNIMVSFRNVKLIRAELGNNAGLYGAMYNAQSL